MACVEKKATITKTRNKAGRIITKINNQKVCGDRTEDLQENQEQEHLETWESLVYPEALKAAPEMVDVVVEDTRTGDRYTKKVPVWALEKMPDPDLVQQHLLPPEKEPIREAFKKFL
jgi:hypothetical protein